MLLAFLVSSMNAFAFNNDFECEARIDADNVLKVEVERTPFPRDQKEILVKVVNDDDNTVAMEESYWATARFDRMMKEIEYWGGGIDFSIRLWPDVRPQWGRTYFGNFQSFDVADGRYFSNMTCRYTGF
jgi:hypothetical protein